MRHACGMIICLSLLACAARQEAAPCPDPRPRVCTMEYAPSCAQLTDGGSREYPSRCNACADEAVVATVDGKCPE